MTEGDAVSLWDVGLSTQTGRVKRPPTRLTTNAGRRGALMHTKRRLGLHEFGDPNGYLVAAL